MDQNDTMKATGNILVFTQWSYKDALVQTYTLPYVDIIRKIISPERKILLLTAEQNPIALNEHETEAINADWAKKNMKLLPQLYRRFGFRKMIGLVGNLFKLYRIIKKEKIRTIHAVCTPAGGLAYILSVLTGARFVVDSYEPHAEAMVENGTWKKNGLAFKILFFFEKKQTEKAAALIGTTVGMKQYAADKFNVQVKNFFVKPACVNLVKFYPREKDDRLLKKLGLENKIVCVYAGKLGGIYFKEEVFNFIRACYDQWNDDFRFLMLTNAPREEIDVECQRAGLPKNIVISQFIFHDEVPAYLSLGDFAINPVKPVPTKRYCTSIKDGEYWAMGLPVIISPNISDDSGIIESENIGIVMDFADQHQFSHALSRLEQLLKSKNDLTKRIRCTGERYRSYSIAENIYRIIYDKK
jgi:glycosyltransferase involved in cell wall biosynthesis